MGIIKTLMDKMSFAEIIKLKSREDNADKICAVS